jgi:hypothetical protein
VGREAERRRKEKRGEREIVSEVTRKIPVKEIDPMISTQQIIKIRCPLVVCMNWNPFIACAGTYHNSVHALS